MRLKIEEIMSSATTITNTAHTSHIVLQHAASSACPLLMLNFMRTLRPRIWNCVSFFLRVAPPVSVAPACARACMCLKRAAAAAAALTLAAAAAGVGALVATTGDAMAGGSGAVARSSGTSAAPAC
jgi:hypothetical protein